jgi:ABC-type phosphate transport system permease subunit
MQVEVNLWAVLLAAASTMVVGSTWYSKFLFLDKWAKLAKVDLKNMKEGSFAPIVVTVIVSVISAFVLAQLAFMYDNFFNNGFLQAGVVTAFWAWLGFTAARFITHDAFEYRPWKLTAINVAHEFVTFILMGLIIGLLPPS